MVASIGSSDCVGGDRRSLTSRLRHLGPAGLERVPPAADRDLPQGRRGVARSAPPRVAPDRGVRFYLLCALALSLGLLGSSTVGAGEPTAAPQARALHQEFARVVESHLSAWNALTVGERDYCNNIDYKLVHGDHVSFRDVRYMGEHCIPDPAHDKLSAGEIAAIIDIATNAVQIAGEINDWLVLNSPTVAAIEAAPSYDTDTEGAIEGGYTWGVTGSTGSPATDSSAGRGKHRNQ